MQLLICYAVGLGLLFGAFAATPASADYHHHHHHCWWHHGHHYCHV